VGGILAGAFGSRFVTGLGGGELVDPVDCGVLEGATGIGVGRSSAGVGVEIFTPGGGLIARTGSTIGACGREECRGVAVSEGELVALAAGEIVGDATGDGETLALGDSTGAAAVGLTVGLGVGVGLVFVVDLLRFLCGVGDGPLNMCLSLSPSVSSCVPRAIHTAGISITSEIQMSRFTLPIL